MNSNIESYKDVYITHDLYISFACADKDKNFTNTQIIEIVEQSLKEVLYSVRYNRSIEDEQQIINQEIEKLENLEIYQLSDVNIQNLIDVISPIRNSGILPYYTLKAIGCYFALEYLDNQTGDIALSIANGGIKKAIIQRCGFIHEMEAVQQIADEFNQVIKSGLNIPNKLRIMAMKSAYQSGYMYESTVKGCAQCTIAGLFGVTGKKEEFLFRAANGFASGMGLFGDGACGGYSGGLLILGTYVGRRFEFIDSDREQKDMSYKVSDLLHTKFIDTYGSVICHDIHRDIFDRAFHIRDEKEKEDFELAGAHNKDKCPAVVGTACMWVTEILIDEGLIQLDEKILLSL